MVCAAVVKVTSATYVLTLDKAHFLLVPPAPSSTIIKSASAKPAPISVPPSISMFVMATVLEIEPVIVVASKVSTTNVPGVIVKLPELEAVK